MTVARPFETSALKGLRQMAARTAAARMMRPAWWEVEWELCRWAEAAGSMSGGPAARRAMAYRRQSVLAARGRLGPARSPGMLGTSSTPGMLGTSATSASDLHPIWHWLL